MRPDEHKQACRQTNTDINRDTDRGGKNDIRLTSMDRLDRQKWIHSQTNQETCISKREGRTRPSQNKGADMMHYRDKEAGGSEEER